MAKRYKGTGLPSGEAMRDYLKGNPPPDLAAYKAAGMLLGMDYDPATQCFIDQPNRTWLDRDTLEPVNRDELTRRRHCFTTKMKGA